MEFINVYIKNEMFKLPIPHQRLKHLISKKFSIEDSRIETGIEDIYNIRKIDCKNIPIGDERINVFLLNFYLGLMKTNKNIDLDEQINAGVEELINEINSLLKANLSFEEIILLMNNPKEIGNLIGKKKKEQIKKETKLQYDQTFSINLLRNKQKEIDNES